MLVQIDASPHDWLERRGPNMTWLGGIDDATRKVLALHFQPTEDQDGYLRLLRTIAQQYGLPLAYYHDWHTILRSPEEPKLDDKLAGRLPMSQIQRVTAQIRRGIDRGAFSPSQRPSQSVFSNPSSREVYRKDDQTFEEAEVDLAHFVNEIDNAKRLHSTLVY